MTTEEIEQKVSQINEIMERHDIEVMDDYFHDVFRDKYRKDIFSIKAQRFFDSETEAQEVLNETLSKLVEYDKNHQTTIDANQN